MTFRQEPHSLSSPFPKTTTFHRHLVNGTKEPNWCKGSPVRHLVALNQEYDKPEFLGEKRDDYSLSSSLSSGLGLRVELLSDKRGQEGRFLSFHPFVEEGEKST